MLTDEQLKICKNLLLTRQSELIAHVQDHFGLEESAKDMTGELSAYDNHPADSGTELFEREKDIALQSRAETELEAINAALHAIHEGTYSICQTCGADINFDRLQAVPTTAYCVLHAPQSGFDSNDSNSAETTFHPRIHSFREALLNDDRENAWQDVSQYGTSTTSSDFYNDQNQGHDLTNEQNSHNDSEPVEDAFLMADIEGKYTGYRRKQ